jgi:glutathione S-transferase
MKRLLYVDAQSASPYAMSAFLAMNEKQLPFELKAVDLSANAHHAASYAAASLTRRVPTLVHDGFALSESSAITEYLDAGFEGAPLYPA